MKFKKLTLLGFKSFANKLEVKFGEGITAIVGPNGCGKSNVADAVRWVLGEQSAKLLRGSKMMDVIFNGTKTRKALSYAEVSLTFDNHDRSLFPSCAFEEVMITRKLYRSGESEYYINGALCKLREIGDLLRDAGFAIDGYTIIGQGRVMEIVSAKPEDRRLIFEEAAGITKYKHKKIEAERKNARTRENLVRINDILSGDTERLAPLARQAERTRTYRELKDKLKYHEINLYINKYETAADTKERLSDVIADIQSQIDEKQSAYSAASNEYTAAMTELQSLDSKLEQYRNELMVVNIDKQKLVGDIELHKQRLDNLSEQTRSLMATNATLSDDNNQMTVIVAQKQEELQTRNDELNALREENVKLNAEYAALSEKVAVEEQKINNARKALIDAMERRAAVNRSVGELSAECASLADQIVELKIRLDDYISRINYATDNYKAKTAELEKVRRERDELSAQKAAANEENVGVAAKLAELGRALADANQEYSALLARKRLMEEVQKDAYSYAVRKLLEDSEENKGVRDAIIGVIGKAITVKEGFEVAIDTALGPAVNNIVTADEDAAKLLVQHLKDKRYGRATFLPISAFKARYIDNKYMPMLKRHGCFGVAIDVLTFDKVYESVIGGLLGTTVIVDNVDTAVRLARESNYGFRIVTLEGDIVTPQGSITGGSKRSDATNVFAHERSLKDIVAQIDEQKTRLDGLQSDSDASARRNEELIKLIRELSSDIHDYDLAEAALVAQNTAQSSTLNTLVERRNADEKSLELLQKRLDEANADLEAVGSVDGEIDMDARAEENARITEQFEALRSECDRLREAVNAKNLATVTLEKDTERLQSDISRIKSEATAVCARISANNMFILSNNREMQSLDEKIKNLAAGGADDHDNRRARIQEKIDNFSQRKSDLNIKAVENDRARLEYNDMIAALIERKHEQEILLAQVDVNMENMQLAITDNYGLSYDGCLEFKDDNYDSDSGEVEILKLKRRIVNLGAINENAIEEAQELSQKVGKLNAQRDDLMRSLADEERVIKEMSTNMMRDFDRCFAQIRENFQSIFCDLFGGGKADLLLTENEDPLLRGVEIMAQPPNKNLQSISLFSGGEKTLTAIAIMFAIIKLRPMPFCMLDEIEAALDDANTTRVANMIRRFSSNTQFIVITHRKPTMELSDSLFGVTMEEEGVSTIVSVKLGEAIAHAMPAKKAQQDQ